MLLVFAGVTIYNEGVAAGNNETALGESSGNYRPCGRLTYPILLRALSRLRTRKTRVTTGCKA